MSQDHPVVAAFFVTLQEAVRRRGIDQAAVFRLCGHRWRYAPADLESCGRDLDRARLARLDGRPLWGDADRAVLLHSWEEAVRLMGIPGPSRAAARLPPYEFRVGFSSNLADYYPNSFPGSADPSAWFAARHEWALRAGGWYGAPRAQTQLWLPPPSAEAEQGYEAVAEEVWRLLGGPERVPARPTLASLASRDWWGTEGVREVLPEEALDYLRGRARVQDAASQRGQEARGTFGFYAVEWLDPGRGKWRKLNDLD